MTTPTSKTYRLFISSTFSDFQEERRVLQTEVFPQIKRYAAEHGYTFQPIDLRWGVSDEAQLDQKTLELCLSEVRACKTHMHPNFLILAGNRYGWVPLPYAIEKTEYETIYNYADNKELLDEWYKLDYNHLPPSYILKEREGAYTDYDTWVEVENSLRDTLQNALNQAQLPKEQSRKYFLSATEAEVEEGIIPYDEPTEFQEKVLLKDNPDLIKIDPKYIFGFLREIDVQSKQGSKFIGSEEDRTKAQAFKERLKANIAPQNILEATTRQIDTEHLDTAYLEEFKERITAFLKQQIDAQKQREKELHLTPLEIELEAQSYFAANKRKGFLKTPPLENLLQDIQNYIQSGETGEPFILYGASGRGKSALMAKAIEEAKANSQKRVLYRFVGATPNSNSTKEILTSIFDEIGIDIRSEKEKEQEKKETLSLMDADKESETFEQFCQRVYDRIQNLDKELVIFIDAVDQLQNDDTFLWLPKKLPANVKIVLSALDDDNYQADSKYCQALKEKFTNLHEIPPFSEPVALLKQLLQEEHRTLSKAQEEYFLKLYEQVRSPLYVVLAAREIKEWRSYDNSQTLAATQKGVVEEFIDNLTEFHHHNERFVHKVLGYLYASRDGLNENELLELLATDAKFIEHVAPETFHENPTHELPLVHWSRLHTELKPFLSVKSQEGEELLYFFHREFEDAISEQKWQKEEHEAIIDATQKKILQTQDQDFDKNRWGRLYIALITEYELRYKDKAKQKEFAGFLADTKNLKEKWIARCILEISRIGSEHNQHNRMFKAIAYLEISKLIAEKLYSENPERWAGYYTTSLNNLAGSYYTLNRLEKAIELQKRALEIEEKLYSENPDRWAEYYTTSLNNLASSYYDLNRLEKAIELFKRALEIREKLYSENPERWAEDYTGSLNNLASSYKNINHLEEAIELQERALEILEKLYSENPDRWVEDYTLTLSNLSFSYKKLNNLDKAIELEKLSLKIREKLYSENSDKWVDAYTISLNNLALYYQELNHVDKAIELQERALEIRKKLYSQNPNRWVEAYTTSLTSLAFSYYKQNRLDEAIELEKLSLKIREKLYSENPDRWAQYYATSLNNLANSYYNLNRLEEAIELLEKTLEIREKLYSENPERWAETYTRSLNNLAYSYKNLNRLEEAIELEERALEITKQLYSQNQDRWAGFYTTSLNNLASSYSKLNRLEKVIELQERILETTQKLYSQKPEIWTENYTISLINLAGSYQNINHLDKALELYIRAIEILEKVYSQNSEKWAEVYTLSLNNLATSYYNLSHFDKAIKLQNRLLEITQQLYSETPERWVEDYTSLLNSLAGSLYQSGNKKEALYKLQKAYETAKKHFGEIDPRTQEYKENYIQVKDELDSIEEIEEDSLDISEDELTSINDFLTELIRYTSSESTEIKEEATLTDLLYLSKFISYINEEEEIGIMSFFNALGFIELNEIGKEIFSEIDINQLPVYNDAKKHIEQAKNLPKKQYDNTLKELAKRLKEMLGDTPIGTLR